MKSRQVAILVIATLLSSCLARTAVCQNRPESVTPCQLQTDPAAYNRKVVEVTAFVSHAFEDFTLFDPTCRSWPAVWLEYGGKIKSGTMYCCGVTPDRSRPDFLEVDGIAVPLKDDDQFRAFDKLVQPPFRSGPYGSVVHATLVGRFFSRASSNESPAGGYGHMGCCSLLAIQEIQAVDPHNRDDLDYGAVADQPNISKAGCWSQQITPRKASDVIATQKSAETGGHDWVFDDPRRVAFESIAQLSKDKPQFATELREKRRAQGRFVYEWKRNSKADSYLVVVSRPYLLTFFARDSNRIPWILAAAYVSSCDKSRGPALSIP